MPSQFLVRLWQQLNPFSRLRHAEAQTPNGLYSEEVFHLAVQRERARTDRTGLAFSLVVFNVGAEQGENSLLATLSQVLKQRMRATDEVGWLESGRLGVLLYNTSGEGGYQFAQQVGELVAPHAPPKYTVYIYPSDKGLHQLAIKEAQQKRAASANGDNHSESVDDAAPQQGTSPGMAFQGLESFFKQPTPWWKRSMDVFGSGLGLLLLSPVILPVGLYIKLVSPGPMFFKQKRIGYLGEEFVMWKLRTMHVNVDTSKHQKYLAELIKSGDSNNKPMIKLDDAPQLIPHANLIRKSCIDELPQLINVFLGEMSMIGPRPPIPYEVAEYAIWHRGRFDALPGMTGLWQVSGKNRLTFNQMVRLDIEYARRQSFWLDMVILLRTPMAIVMQVRDTLVKPKK